MSHQTNVTRIKAVHHALGELRDSVVYVGGATVSLYAEKQAEEVRATDDVDVLVEIWSYKDYAAIEEQLRRMGFVNDSESPIMCRYKLHGLTVDIMATGKDVLGFSNKWYPDGFKHAIDIALDNNVSIKIFPSPYFIASKLEAFMSPSREGNNEGRFSSDFEDIVFILENRKAVWEEMNTAPHEVRDYLKDIFRKLMRNVEFEEWIDAHAGYGTPPATYFIMEELKKFIS